MGLLTLFRLVCYAILWVFAACTLGMAAARLHYTLHLPARDPLNDGISFYDGIIAEIVAASGLTILLTPLLFVRIHRRHDRGFMSTLGGELAALTILFVLWLVGAIIVTKKWGDLGWCHVYSACRLLTAIVAFTWMSWIMTFFLLVSCLWYIIRHSGSTHPVHGRYYTDDMRQV
jgi:hypothetical protein